MNKISITGITKKAGVYQFMNKLNKKVYIGSSINIYYRLKDHLKLLRNNKHYNKHLQDSWNKYTEENFVFSVLMTCKKEDILINEQKYIDAKQSCNKDKGYNIIPYATNNSGYKWTEEYRIKRSEYEKNKYKNLSAEEKEKVRQKMIYISKYRKNFKKKRKTRIAQSKKMKFTDSLGNIYIPELPSEFMKKNNLDLSYCHKVAKNKPVPTYGRNGVKYYTIPKSHKGWKIEYII